jgi:predicted Ser/Thr protein kinase
VADSRNPSGRRPPILPLPPPRLDADADLRRRAQTSEATGELPRLPEVGVERHGRRDAGNEVRVDPRALAPGRDSLTGARSIAVDAGRALKGGLRSNPTPTPPAQPRVRREREPRDQTPKPPARSQGQRVQTAEHSSLIGGRYQILQRIGQGGMGKVYKVTHAHLSRIFALKIISNQVAETDEARELFYREARFASAMTHPNITAVVDFGEDEKVGMFMVMEYVEGEPLNRVLFREKRIEVRRACDMILQVAEALHYIHRQNVVHCDIKTENILIGEEEVEGKRRRMFAKLLDFGLARSLVATRASTSLSGTPHYVAPERIRGEPASPASDVYGVGILMYELVTGAVPWDGPVQKILSGHLDEVPKRPAQIVDGLDPAVDALIMHALAKRPAERHKDMAAFIYELRTVMDMLGFGRRRSGGGQQRRVVIEQKGQEKGDKVSRRDELARTAFDGCRLPLALLTSQGQIVAANPAFAKFVMGVSVQVEGLPVKSTALATAWSTAEQDIARTLAGNPVRRIIEIDVTDHEVRRLLLWLDAVSNEHVVLGVQPLEL